jgi:hypothetical protein
METIQEWISDAASWVSDNSTDVVYIGIAVLAIALLNGGGGRR